MKVRLILLFILGSFGCSGPMLSIKSGIKIETLGIYIESEPGIIPQIKNGFEQELTEAIDRYNSTGRNRFRLRKSEHPEECSIRLKLVATKLVTPSEQATSAAVSTIGLALPFIMIAAGAEFAIAFWYFPKTKSLVEMSLSEDIDGSQLPSTQTVYSSPGFLKNPDQQIDRHIAGFDKFILNAVKQIGKTYQ